MAMSPPYGAVLRQLRKAAGVSSQETLSTLLELGGKTTVARWERGEVVPSPHLVEELIKFYSAHGNIWRTYSAGTLQGYTVSPEWLRDITVEARDIAAGDGKLVKTPLREVAEKRAQSVDSLRRKPTVPGDRSRFIRDVTIPDGSRIQVHTHITKIWEIENVGDVPWRNRYLQRLGPSSGRGRLKSAERTPVPDTEPGQRCVISVEMDTPGMPGSCLATWKMVDNNGTLLFPNQAALFVSIDIVEDGG